jgi:hypothetical protein
MCSSMPYETSTQTAKLHFKEVKQSKKEDMEGGKTLSSSLIAPF